MSIFDDKQIDLDLNGPILSFTTNPTGVGSTGVVSGGTGGGTVSLTGIATATFPTSANNAGYVTYRWYEEGVGALSDSTYVTGTATTTLTLSNLITPSDNDRKFFVQADYVPSYYVTGNATNEPLNSGVGTVTVDPLIDIISQPTSSTTIAGNNAIFTANASLTNDGTDITYQWQLDGENITDGDITTNTVTEGDRVTVDLTGSSRTYTIPAGATGVEVTLAGASGGNGGGIGGYRAGGTGGAGRTAWLTIAPRTDAYILKVECGTRGNDGQVGGHSHGHGGYTLNNKSGGAGGHGLTGGGGGGGASALYISGYLVAVVGGGGGGGGGGTIAATDPNFHEGAGGDSDSITTTTVLDLSGAIGRTGGSEGGGVGHGGGGGGGGANIRVDGGNASNTVTAQGGEGGRTYIRTDQVGNAKGTTTNINASGWALLSFVDTGTTVENQPKITTVSGATSKTLTLNTNNAGIGFTVSAIISSESATNSPLTSDIVEYKVVSSEDEANLVIEAIGVNNTATVSLIDLNNDTDGDLEISAAAVNINDNIFTQFYSLYARDRDLDVEMDLYGGMGTAYGLDENGSPTRVIRTGPGAKGGEGGFSRIRFTMKQNEEYVIAGLVDSIRTPFVYRKGALMVCVGEGGHGTIDSHGGPGGGVNIAGENGFGWEGSQPGGDLIPEGALTLNGIFGSSFIAPTLYPGDAQAGTPAFLTEGGRTIRCTKGVYWAQQGIPPCTAMSPEMKFRLSDGTEVTNTANIVRGFKAGYNIIQTAGKALGFKGARGGNGATGGVGGTNNSGGGGSGYTDGSVTVVDTKLGGSTEEPKILLRMQS